MLSWFPSLATLGGHVRARNLLIVCGIVIGLALASAATWFLAESRANDISDAERELKNLSFILSEELDRRLQGLDLLQVGLIEHMQQLGIDSPESFKRQMTSFAVHQDLAHRIAGLPHIAALSLHDTDGKLINFSRSWPAPDIDVRDRDFIKILLVPKPPMTVISEPLKSKTTGQWTIYFSRRFVAPDGRFIGIVLSTIFMDYFEQLFAGISLSDDGGFGLYRSDGMLLARFPQADPQIGLTFDGTDNFNRMRASLDHGVARITSMIDGKDRLVAGHSVAHYPLLISVSNSMDAILGVWRTLARTFGAVTIILELVIAVTVVLAIRHLRSHALLEAADERERGARALQQQGQRYNTALNNMLQGLLMFDPAGNLVVVNRSFCRMFGVPDGALVPGMEYDAVADAVVAASQVTAEDMQGARERHAESLAHGQRTTATWEIAGGRAFKITDLPMQEGWLTTFEEITDQRASEARMVHLAHHDALTDLPNRVLFRRKLTDALAYARRGEGLALLFLDLDQFKAVNDTLGHPVGDELLRAVSERLAGQLRETDTVARLGGDEFAIVQSRIDKPAEATAFATRLIDLIETPFDVAGHQIVISTSIGIAFAPQDGTDADQLLRSADLAMYRAKSDGRGVYRLFHAEMDAQMQARRLLELDLRQAMACGQLEVFYQPVISVHHQAVAGFEALLRWRHPQRGLVPPSEFIPLAEEIGLITPIGEWVLRQACADAALWPGMLTVAVNLSSVQFRSRNLVPAVAAALRASALSPSRLELEITETVMLEDTVATVETLSELHGLGVSIAMDDFGTGYSSLSYLRSFPFDRVKIDQSFVRELGHRRDCGAIVRAVASLSNELGMATTAEGVETPEQLDALRAIGCTEVQGYLFSPAVPASQVPDLLSRLPAMIDASLGLKADGTRLALVQG
jgi:diguanylate cyclase (GGDEF)-like protein